MHQPRPSRERNRQHLPLLIVSCRRASRFHTALTWIIGSFLVAVLASCSTSGARDVREPPTSPVSSGGPGAVALEYMRAVVRGDLKSAAEYVLPDQKGMLQALALGAGPGTIARVWGNVSLGRVETSDDSATASFLGTMCRSASGGAGTPADTECIEEHDVRTSSPQFLVHLARVSPVEWRVTFYPSIR